MRLSGLAGQNYYQAAMEGAQSTQNLIDQRRYAAMQMQMFQQQQQDRQRQQAALAAAGNALPQLIGGQTPQQLPPPPGAVSAGGAPALSPTLGWQIPPPPQTPAPSQASQPMMQPQGQGGGGVPLPSGPVPGQMPRPPLPQGGPQGQMPQAGLPPFRPLPASGSPAQASPGAIPAPPPAAPTQQQPSSGPLTLESAVKVLRDQGLSGADLMAGLAQLTPILDSQAKAQAAQLQQQFQRELQLANLQEHYDSLRQRAEDNSANRADREQAHADSLGIQQAMLDLRRQEFSVRNPAPSSGAPNIAPDATGKLPPAQAVGGYSGDAIDAMSKAYAAGNTAVVNGLGRNTADRNVRAAVTDRAAALQKQTGGDMATTPIEYKANTRGAIVNAQQGAKVDAAAGALTQPGGIGDQFQSSIDALNRTGIPIANEAQMATLRATNDPRIAAYDAAQNGVVSEAAQILGRGTLTVNSMEEARRVVNGWHTSAQAKAGLAQLKKEAETTVSASRKEVGTSASGGAPASGSGGSIVNWGDLK